MNSTCSPIRSLMFLCMLMVTFSLSAQKPANNSYHEPLSGQEGKDVIWVPTPQELVDKMLDMAKVTPADYVMDLGSGDGRLVISAARRGANALGIEYNSEMVEFAKQKALQEGLDNKAKFIQADLFETDFSKATVITLFLLTDLNIRLRPKLLELKPGTRIVSNTFTMGDWKSDERASISGDCDSWCNAFLWIIPAKAGGKWRLDNGELILTQKYQMISGEYKTGKETTYITDGRLNGNEISFQVNNIKYKGVVSGKIIRGTLVNKGETLNWEATRL